MKDIASLIATAEESELKLILRSIEKRLRVRGRKTPFQSAEADMFTVAEGKKYLTSEQLDVATRAFAGWAGEARNAVQRLSRARIRMAFLLIRYGGLRLGEVLALDDTADIEAASAQIFIRGTHQRHVQMPEEVLRDVVALLSSPMCFSLRGKVFHLDPGYLRRKFYQHASACGLPRELLNPSVLRHSRAIELLRGGVPARVVEAFLGRSRPDGKAEYFALSNDTAKRIVHLYLDREGRMKTSARNAFTGRVTRVISDNLLTEVELTTLSGLKVVSVITNESRQNLRVAEGSVLTATIKAPWVVLSRVEGDCKTSARNKYVGTVAEVKTSGVAAEVVVTLGDRSRVCALVTNESVNVLELAPGMEVLAMFKAFSVILNAE